MRPEQALAQLEGTDAALPDVGQVGVEPQVARGCFLEMVRVDAPRIAAAADQLGALLWLLAMLGQPSEAVRLLGAVLLADVGECPACAFLGQAPRPEQTAAGRIVLGGLVEIVGQLWVLPRWESVGLGMGIGEGDGRASLLDDTAGQHSGQPASGRSGR